MSEKYYQIPERFLVNSESEHGRGAQYVAEE
jgi:hypothetical protein